ncbi:MAG: hypothetical protein JXR77_12040, partial [Lentisphaeria bacterium]|nr:hypothetical protein [Lentisphaeria bacterium]
MTDLVDVQVGFGGSVPALRETVGIDFVAHQLRRHRISGAWVRIAPDGQDFDILRSNDRLFEAAARRADLEWFPCPVVAPAACGDLPPEEQQVDDLVHRGAVAAVIRPGPDCWEPEPWVVTPLLRALE